jgi:hypothetical protein
VNLTKHDFCNKAADGFGATNKSALNYAGYTVDKLDVSASAFTEAALLSDGCINFEFYEAEYVLLGALGV